MNPAFHEQILDAMGQAVMVTDVQGVITYWNTAAENLYGWEREEVLGRNVLEVTPAEMSEAQAREIMEQLMAGTSWTGEFSVRRRDGSTFLARVTDTPILDEHGVCIGIVGISYDLTEEKRAQAAVSHERRRLRQIFESGPAAICVCRGPEHVFESANAAYEELVDRRDLIGKRIIDVLPEIKVKGFIDVLDRVFDNGERYVSSSVETWIRHGDGGAPEQRFVKFVCEPLVETDGSVSGIFFHGVDITEHILATKNEQAAARMNRMIMDNSVDVICTINASGAFVQVSAASARIWGFRPEELYGRPFFQSVYADDHDRTRHAFGVLRSGVKECTFENRFVRRDGTPIPMMWSAVWSEDDRLVYAVGRDASPLKEAQAEQERILEALVKSEARYRGVIQNTSELITLFNADGTVAYQSASVESILGISPEDVIGSTPADFVHPDDLKSVEEALSRLVREGGTATDVFRLQDKHGCWRWFESRKSNLLHDETVGAIIAVSRDITDHVEQEARLLRRDRLMRAAAQAAEVLTTKTDFASAVNRSLALIGESLGASRVYVFENKTHIPTGRLVTSQRFEWTNGAAEPQIDNPDMQDIPVEQSLGRWAESLASGKAVAELVRNAPEVIRPSLENQDILSLLLVPIMVDGNWRGFAGADSCMEECEWTEADVAVLTTVANILAGLFKRLRNQESLRLSEERLRLALDAASMGTWEWDRATDELTGSEHMYRIFGVSAWEFNREKMRFYELVHPEDLDLLLEGGRNSFDTGLPLDVEYRIRRPDGEMRWVQSKGNVSYDDRGAPQRMTGTIADVTDRKTAETALVEAKERAEEMVRLKDSFLANMSHEIRTPLTGILGFSEILAELVTGDEREFVGAIEQNGRRLLDTLNSVLDLAQLKSGTLNTAPSTFDAGLELQHTVSLFGDAALRKRLKLIVDVPPSPLEIVSDRAAFGRILTNLVSNAVKFTEQGAVTVSGRRTGTGVQISVADSGVGIAGEFLPHLFDEFRQESAGLTRTHEGNGLGLAITRQLVELLGGEIAVKSERGKGSTFTVSLPGDSLEAMDEHSAGVAERAASSAEKPRILVVEDSRETREIIQHFLREAYEVETAGSYAEAVGIVQRNSYDAALIDINLGGEETGVDLLHVLRETPGYASTPVVACTAYGLAGDGEKFLKKGFDGYVSKPFRRASLIDAVETALLAEDQA